MNNKTVLTVIAVTLLGAGTLAASSAFAQSISPTQKTSSSLAQQIADKFGLNLSDVQAVFDQNKNDRQAKMQTNVEKKLSQDVADGKITDAQKTLILNKQKELQADRQTWKNLTPAQRQTKLQAERKDLQSWAKQNGIDLKYLMPQGFGKARNWKFGKGRVKTTPTPTP